MYVREHQSEAAIAVYSKALSLDPSLHNIWFNKAHAEIKVGDYDGAAKSLREALKLDPSITAAKHMLQALIDDEAKKATVTDESYVKDLYNSYAPIYDEHGRKLLYSAPRVIRQEMAKIYKAKRNVSDSVGFEVIESPPSNRGALTPLSTCADHDVAPLAECTDHDDHSNCAGQVSFMSRELDILDLGCGTGLAGAWLKDYAKTLVGVDIAESMVNIARKKMLYDDLHVESLTSFLHHCQSTFDLVVAADVMSYIGDLGDIIREVSKVVRAGGHFVFTAETSNDESCLTEKGFRLLRNGRFGYSKAYLEQLISGLGDDFAVVMYVSTF